MDGRLERALGAHPQRCGRLRKGYAPEQVDQFLDRLRRACAGPVPQVKSSQVRSAGFRLVLGGYDVAATDAVLAAVDDALVALEHARALASPQRARWLEGAQALRAAVASRVTAPAGERFPTGRWLERGYHRGDVDALCGLVAEHLAGRRVLRPDQVRAALFRPGRGRRGYREVPVDAFFDRVVELLSAVEATRRT